MLILSHADGFGVNFHQLRQRVLQPPGNGNRAAEGQVKLGELLCRQLGGRVDRSARLADHHIGDLAAFQGGNQLSGENLRFLGSGAVADGDNLCVVLFNQPGQKFFCLLFLVLGMGNVNHAGVQYPAGGIHHGHFAAGAVAGVKANGGFTLYRRLHQQLAQVHGKHLDGGFVCVLGERGADFPFDGRENQSGIGVLGSFPHGFAARRTLFHGGAFHNSHAPVVFQLDGYLQKAFALAPVNGQHPMACQRFDGLAKIVVGLIDGFLVLFGGLGNQQAVGLSHHTETAADGSIIGELFRDDIPSASQRILGSFHAFFRIHIGCGQFQRVGGVPFLFQNGFGEGFQPLFFCHGSPGFALGAVGTV